jgi:hypothetical protein
MRQGNVSGSNSVVLCKPKTYIATPSALQVYLAFALALPVRGGQRPLLITNDQRFGRIQAPGALCAAWAVSQGTL